MVSEKQKAAPIELAKPIVLDDRFTTARITGGKTISVRKGTLAYSYDDIAAERERWQAALNNAEKNGYARGYADGLEVGLATEVSKGRDKHPNPGKVSWNTIRLVCGNCGCKTACVHPSGKTTICALCGRRKKKGGSRK
jgi:hypothetical protein